MSQYIAKRIRFRNGECHSVLQVRHGLPVHEVTAYLDTFRKRGRAANTIHFVCCSLALLYQGLDATKVNLLDRLAAGQFLTIPELGRLASAAQYRADDLEADALDESKPALFRRSSFPTKGLRYPRLASTRFSRSCVRHALGCQ